jgi:hypothetical protein
MRLRAAICTAVLALALAGCSLSPEYQARVRAEGWAIDKTDDAQCQQIAPLHSDAYRTCRKNLADNRNAQQQQAQQRASNALMALGFGMMATSTPPPPQPPDPEDHVCIARNNVLYRC